MYDKLDIGGYMKEINDKLKVLAKIAKFFNEEKITWAVGASLLLFFKGKTDHFNDIDLMVDEKDIEKVKTIMLEIGMVMPRKDNYVRNRNGYASSSKCKV